MADKGGRPTVMTEEVTDEICKWLASGKSLRSICARDDMPVLSTVMLAVVQDRDGFRSKYTHAREAAGYAHADGIIEVVEALRNEGMEPQVAKAIMDGLKWAAERMAPKAHSASQKVDHTSSDGTMTPKAESMAVIEALKAKHEPK